MEGRGKLSNVRNSGVGFGRNESGQEEGIHGWVLTGLDAGYNSGAFNAGNVGEQVAIEETKMLLVWGIMELLTW